MATSARTSTIKVSYGGTRTLTTDAACSLVSGTTYQVSNAAQRVLSPDDAVTVKVGGVTQSATSYTVDYLFGAVTFASAPGGAVTITATYFPLLAAVEIKSYKFTATAALANGNVFGDATIKQIPGLRDLSGTIVALTRPEYNLGGVTLFSLLDGLCLVEIGYPGATYFFRAWVQLESHEATGATDGGVMEYTLNFVGQNKLGVGRTDYASFGWGS